MKCEKIFLIIIFLSLWKLASAQLDDGTIAPDFDAVDVYGNQYNLYSLLEEGKSVVVEFFVSWDENDSWAYHQSHTLDSLWSEYGPDGTNELFVFLIEVDASTDDSCLEGQGSGCDNNWFEDTDFPVINDANIGYEYDVSYWPTVYFICPSKRVFQTGTIDVGGIYAYMSECPFPTDENVGELMRYKSDIYDFCRELTFSPKVIFHNFGTNVISAASFAIYKNDVFVDSLNWSGNLEVYETVVLEFPELSLYETAMLKIEIVSVNDMPNESNYSELYALYEAPRTMERELQVRIKTDFFGEETYWEIRNELGEVCAAGGNELVGAEGGGMHSGLIGEGSYCSNVIYESIIFLSDEGCYEFLIVDDYGDGMCCDWGDGFYEVLDYNGEILFEGGHFQSYEQKYFEILAITPIEEIDASGDLEVFPNPASELVSISLNVNQYDRWNVRVKDELGRDVDNFFVCLMPTKNSFSINVSDYSEGIYFVTLHNASSLFSEKVVVNR